MPAPTPVVEMPHPPAATAAVTPSTPRIDLPLDSRAHVLSDTSSSSVSPVVTTKKVVPPSTESQTASSSLEAEYKEGLTRRRSSRTPTGTPRPNKHTKMSCSASVSRSSSSSSSAVSSSSSSSSAAAAAFGLENLAQLAQVGPRLSIQLSAQVRGDETLDSRRKRWDDTPAFCSCSCKNVVPVLRSSAGSAPQYFQTVVSCLRFLLLLCFDHW
jgi:hypothetical protein